MLTKFLTTNQIRQGVVANFFYSFQFNWSDDEWLGDTAAQMYPDIITQRTVPVIGAVPIIYSGSTHQIGVRNILIPIVIPK